MIVNCKNQRDINLSVSETATSFLNDIRKYEVLSSEEQIELLYKIKNGTYAESEKARAKLIESNQRFVVSFAKKFATNKNVMDLIQEANIGLMTAIEKFDLEMDNNFLTYCAYWMRRKINDYLATTENAVVPANAQKIYIYATKAKNKFYQENHRQPSAIELQEILDSEYDVHIAHAEDLADYVAASIDEPMDDSEDNISTTAREFEERTSSNNINDLIDNEALAEQIKGYLSILTEKERDMVKMSYGIGYEGPMSNDAIGEKYGLCAERVRQILKKSESKLSRTFRKTGC